MLGDVSGMAALEDVRRDDLLDDYLAETIDILNQAEIRLTPAEVQESIGGAVGLGQHIDETLLAVIPEHDPF